ncbi:MAG: thioesterase family protein [Planctomycetaceae bacterium]
MSPIESHDFTFRVRYGETDAMGVVHHAQYFSYFEMGRMELFRAQGGDYREMEARGYLMMIIRAECDFKKPARFDDLLTIRTRVLKLSPAKLEHEYLLLRGEELIAKAHTVLACISRDGQIQRITDEVLFGTATV